LSTAPLEPLDEAVNESSRLQHELSTAPFEPLDEVVNEESPRNNSREDLALGSHDVKNGE